MLKVVFIWMTLDVYNLFLVFCFQGHKDPWYFKVFWLIFLKCLIICRGELQLLFISPTIPTKKALFEQGYLGCSRNICLGNPRTEVSCLILRKGPNKPPCTLSMSFVRWPWGPASWHTAKHRPLLARLPARSTPSSPGADGPALRERKLFWDPPVFILPKWALL